MGGGLGHRQSLGAGYLKDPELLPFELNMLEVALGEVRGIVFFYLLSITNVCVYVYAKGVFLVEVVLSAKASDNEPWGALLSANLPLMHHVLPRSKTYC